MTRTGIDPQDPRADPRDGQFHGYVQLATRATLGVTDIVEGVHQSVWRTLGFPSGPQPDQAQGLTGFIYRSIRATTRLVGDTVESVARATADQPAVDHGARRTSALSILNGVMGDRLAAWRSPFAIPMSFQHDGATLNPAQLRAPSDRLVLLIHGLCLNERHWHLPDQIDHGGAIAEAGGYTPIYLRYNTGKHISDNGRQLSAELEALVENWPVPVREICIVAHSMGGLVARSAVHQARVQQHGWRQSLSKMVFLGSPHGGSPLERAGHWVDGLLAQTPYSAPFARIGQLRSAGISDLRYGMLLEEDWHGRDRFASTPDRPRAVPLPRGVDSYAIAGDLADKPTALSAHLTGDGLVPLRSALGKHEISANALSFEPTQQWIAQRTGHLALLHASGVRNKLLEWLD